MSRVNLTVALIGCCQALEEILAQIGVLFRVYQTFDQASDDHVLYVLGESISGTDFLKIRYLLSRGKGILAPSTKKRAFLSEGIHPQALVQLYDYDHFKKDNRRISTRKKFLFQDTPVYESVAEKPLKILYGEMLDKIRSVYAQQNLLMPILSAYPSPYRGLFSFRVDADEYRQDLFERFLGAARRYKKAISIFINVSNYKKAPQDIRRCLDYGLDVHSHAYYHFTYRSFCQNRINLKKASDYLEQLGIRRCGFAAPSGRWNEGLQGCLDEMGYKFSSDFSYDYDNFPSFPVIKGKRSDCLQIPVHPVCLGIYMGKTKRWDRAIVEAYYRKIFEEKYLSGEPIIFYDHPTTWLGFYPEFMDFVFSIAQGKKEIWITSMSHWADWWLTRRKVKLDAAFYQRAGYIFSLSNASISKHGNYSIRLVDPRHDREATVEIKEGENKVDLPSLSWRQIPRIHSQFDTEQNAGACGGLPCIKNTLKEWLDWERLTPPEEIVVDSLNSATKRLIRMILGK